MARFDLDHRRFDGSRVTNLRREVLVGVDSALVLPYDPARDRTLLVGRAGARRSRLAGRAPGAHWVRLRG